MKKLVTKVILVLLLILLISIIGHLYFLLKKQKQLYDKLKNVYSFQVAELVSSKAEARALILTVNEMNTLIKTRDQLLTEQGQKYKHAIQEIIKSKREIKRLTDLISISSTTTVDTVVVNSIDSVYSCSINYDDGYLSLNAKGNDSVTLSYVYRIKGSFGIVRTKYKRDGTAIKYPELYFWKPWTQKAVVSIDNPNAVVDDLIYIHGNK